jgi:hypothetical protein
VKKGSKIRAATSADIPTVTDQRRRDAREMDLPHGARSATDVVPVSSRCA